MGRRTRNRARRNQSAQVPQPAAQPMPQAAEENRALWPFLTALGIVLVVLAYIFLTGERGDPGPTPAQKIRTLTEQYVEAYNAGDQGRLDALSCDGIKPEESPMDGEPKGVAIKRMRSESPEPGVAKADVTLTIDDTEKITQWWYAEDGDGWLVCGE